MFEYTNILRKDIDIYIFVICNDFTPFNNSNADFYNKKRI
jgi:hypothetical protein